MKPNTKRSRTPDERERLRWLLDFLQRDVTTLRTGERLDLADDMDRLLWLRDPAVVEAPDAPDAYAHDLAKLRGAPDVSWPTALVSDVHAKINAGVARLEAGRSWEPFTPVAVDGAVPKPDALLPIFTVQADKTIARRYHGTYGAVMLASAVDLLVAAWPLIRRCELATCRRWFLPEHGRQRFHDPKCANLARVRRHSVKRDYTREEANAALREAKKKKKQIVGKRRKTR
jgi:hypothetical protein